MNSGHLDIPDFDAKTAVEAARGIKGYYKTLTWQERLCVANYLNSIEYNYPENDPPKLDRSYFRAWTLEEKNEYYNNK